jgi:hypothetical protein
MNCQHIDYKFLKVTCKKSKDLQIKHILELFDKLIVPILNYGCEIWNFAEEK